MRSEVFLFAPVWWFAFRPRRAQSNTARVLVRLALTVWLAAIRLIASTDPLRERIAAAAVDGGTEFARGLFGPGAR